MTMRRPDYRAAKAKAADVLKENFVMEPPVRVDQLAPYYGLRVTEAAFPPEHSNVSGFIDLEAKAIVLNEEDPTTRKSFTIAHELGHWLLHREELDRDPDRSVLLRLPLGGPDADPLEKEANCFAANLLVPEAFLLKYASIEPWLAARVFGVSRDVIGYRLKRLR